MSNVITNLNAVRARMLAAAEASGLAADSVTLLAVSKTRSAADVRAAVAAGQRAFGENQLQDAQPKIAALGNADLEWHFIGPIQSNKTRAIAEQFSWVHSVDRVKIAKRLSEQRPAGLPPLNVCIQYNVSGEQSKAGITGAELAAVASEISALPRLKLRGLMAIPAPNPNYLEQRAVFALVREALAQLNAHGYQLDTLSMGMTDDMEAAIAEGATMIRIGTAIFGARAKPPVVRN
jgi:PLP dependent protein